MALFSAALLGGAYAQDRMWATYYGGENGAFGRSCAVATDGSVYVSGTTSSTNNIAMNGHQNTYGGGGDAFLAKFSADGIRLWATYYGGSGADQGSSCTVDLEGNVYLAGSTSSTNDIAANGLQMTFGGGTPSEGDAFLVKFDAGGTRLWATYYGGSGPELGSFCAVDGLGNVYLTGHAGSDAGISSNGHQNSRGGQTDAFLVKFDPDGSRVWGTYYGGDIPDDGWSCAVDAEGNVFLAGTTLSYDDISLNGHQNTLMSSYAAFLVKFNANGERLWATYYGGTDQTEGNSCAVDAEGNVYMVGSTRSSDGIAANGHQNVFGGGTFSDAFLVKFNSSGTRLWGTYYGGGSSELGNGWDDGHSCAVDADGNVYLSGQTQSADAIAANGFQNNFGGGGGLQGAPGDAFLAKFDPNGIRLWGTYYGGPDGDRGYSCAANSDGHVYLVGYTNSAEGIAEGGHQNTLGGGSDAYLAKFDGSSVGFIERAALPHAELFPNPTSGQFTLAMNGTFELSVFDAIGKQVLANRKVNGTVHTFDIGDVAPGLYTVVLWKEKDTIQRIPLIKQ